ncbi:Bug family tripartite tricarboxylate transporter substrate binding protein [Siccirubricoccus phaeus]|uniref:Bug family tripartite tricarboxylate transporter substrate binding protein n=1 Tax=Siccirubricoccus phaeus TaxID=2595053 RepID=UPI0011F351BE|nr:tripartite tricarboxylate transporter substrate binding protein [Siccirubricoccus phaeus]
MPGHTAAVARRALLAAPALLPAARAWAAWPDRPVRLIVPFPAGSATDTITRSLAEPLARALGQSVVVDNRGGANGVIGAEAAARAAPDGYSLLIYSTSNASVNPHTLRRLPYDPLRDFAPIGFIAEMPYVLVVPAASPARDLAAFLELARRRPGEVTYSFPNSASLIAISMLARMAGVQVSPIPYRGGPEALTDVVAGRIDATFTDFANGLAQVRDGKLRALAVTTARPFPLAPEIPPVASVAAGYDLTVWYGLAAPAGTPVPILRRASAALDAALDDPGLTARLATQGYVPRKMGPEEFADFLHRQLALWGERVRAAGIEPQ